MNYPIWIVSATDMFAGKGGASSGGSMLTVLAVGEDAELLKSRAEVLRKTGANVLCSGVANALVFVKGWEFDLIVLCHTIEETKVMQITEATRERSSKTLVLLLVSAVADVVSDRQSEGITVDARAFAKPDCLIRSTVELLNRRATPGSVQRFPDRQSQQRTGRKRPANYPADIAARSVLQAS